MLADGPRTSADEPDTSQFASLSDANVLTQTQLRLPEDLGRRLSDISERRRLELLTDEEQQELLALIQIYERYWLRQSEALAEAARRGLTTLIHP